MEIPRDALMVWEDVSSEKGIHGKMWFTLLSGNRHTQISFKVSSVTLTTGERIQGGLQDVSHLKMCMKS